VQILVKFPTRSRRQKFKSVLGQYDHLATGTPLYLVSYDIDDPNMVGIEKEYTDYRHVIFDRDRSPNKIHACNRNIDKVKEPWDILVLASDDMICTRQGWDTIIIELMERHFPDTDGVLHFNDGHTGSTCATMTIMGRKYYNRFGYIYDPAYKSLFCDNEYMDVAKKLEKYCYFSEIIFTHEHPIWNGNRGHDKLYERNNRFYKQDQITYEQRKRANFPRSR